MLLLLRKRFFHSRVSVRCSSSTRGFDKNVNPTQYCIDLVRRSAYEHYLATLLLPEQLRIPAFAIRALSVEVAGVRDAVSDRTIGLMRLQFWNETIDKLYSDKVPNHPVSLQLSKVIQKFKPEKELFHKLISSREVFLRNNPFDTLEDVEEYGENAFGSVYKLLLDCVTNPSKHSVYAVTQLGKCEGLVTLLRATPHNAAKRRVNLPTNLMMEYDISVEQVIRGEQLEGLRTLTEFVASRSQEHLDSCRFRLKYLPVEDRLVLLPAVAVDNYLDKLSKVKCDVFDKRLQIRNSWLPAALYWHKFRQTY